jgi:hypothetical protein
MKYLITALLLAWSLIGHSQHFFLRDSQGKIITTESGGVLSILRAEDTASAVLIQPPDTAQLFDVVTYNPGDVSTPGLAQGIQAYWSYEETSGVIAYDSTTNYDGTLINTPTKSATGISNLCFTYDASSEEWIDHGTNFWDVGTSDLTVSAWIKLSTTGAQYGIIGNWGDDPYWYIRVNSVLVFGIVNPDGLGNIETRSNSASPLTTGVWYHIVYQLDRDGDALLYINNVLQTDQDDISSHSAVDISNSNTHAVGRIGNDAGSYYMDGEIDEVSVYNRKISTNESSQLYNLGAGKFWPFGVIGGDSLRMVINGEDTRADTGYVLWKYDGWATDTNDGTLMFRFAFDDMEAYRDTVFPWSGYADTIVYFTMHTKWGTSVTAVGGRDTVFVDSSDVIPVVQDPSEWIIYSVYDFEDHTGLPSEYTRAMFLADYGHNPNLSGRTSDFQRFPECWEGLVVDSIIVDAQTGSKVVQINFEDTCCYSPQGELVCGQLPYRSGNTWRYDLPEYQEIYLSYNIKFRPGFEWNFGGKLNNLDGGADLGDSTLILNTKPGYGEGFSGGMMWNGGNNIRLYIDPNYPNEGGGMTDYFFYQGQTPPRWGEQDWWNTYQPAGLDYDTYFPLNSPQSHFFVFKTTPERWYNVTYRFVMNTWTGQGPGSANSDGLYEGYINGKLVHVKPNMLMVDDSQEGLGVNQMTTSTFFGGGANFQAPQRDEWIRYDDIILWIYDPSADVPRGNEVSPEGRVLNLPGEKKFE